MTLVHVQSDNPEDATAFHAAATEKIVQVLTSYFIGCVEVAGVEAVARQCVGTVLMEYYKRNPAVDLDRLNQGMQADEAKQR